MIVSCLGVFYEVDDRSQFTCELSGESARMNRTFVGYKTSICIRTRRQKIILMDKMYLSSVGRRFAVFAQLRYAVRRIWVSYYANEFDLTIPIYFVLVPFRRCETRKKPINQKKITREIRNPHSATIAQIALHHRLRHDVVRRALNGTAMFESSWNAKRRNKRHRRRCCIESSQNTT
jgi:hypothetical protein